MKENVLENPFSVRDLLSNRTMSELVSTAKNLGIKGYSGKTKAVLIEMLYPKITNAALLKDLLLVCDRRSWACILDTASSPSPVSIPAIALPPCKTLAGLGILQYSEGSAGAFLSLPTEIKEIVAQFSNDGFLAQKEIADLLDRYALAVTHLYGLIRQDDFVSIFNAQNSHKTNIDEVFSLLVQHISADAPYGFWGEYLTHSLFEDDEYKDAEDLLLAKKGKRLYVPDKPSLLQYEDPHYYEESSASHNFKNYFIRKLHCSEQLAAKITSEFSFACTVDSTIGNALRLLDGYNLPITKSQVKEIIPLLVDFANHTRKWSNCGYTPNEIHQQTLHNAPIRQGRKIGRNEPCPCGSGKKYKKCCGR